MIQAPDNALQFERHELPVITVSDFGSEPRQKLRYALKVGQEEKVTMTVAMDMKTTIEGMPAQSISMPAYDTIMLMRVVEITPEGDVRTEFEVIEVIPPPSDGEDVAALIGAEVVKTKGMAGWSLTSPRGEPLASAVTSFGGLESSADNINSLSNSLRNAAAPFPEGAVGAGATWEARSTVSNDALAVHQIATYHLTQLSESGGNLAVTIHQEADPQRLQSPEELPDAVIDLTSMISTGEGDFAFDLHSLTPSLSMIVDMSIKTATEAMGMNMNTEVTTRMELSMGPTEG